MACECLLEIFLRKGKPEERVQMMFIFEKMDLICSALKTPTGDSDEDYQFHKILSQLLSHIGCTLVELRTLVERPLHYQMYLEVMLELLQYPSILIRSHVVPFWNSLMQHGTLTALLIPSDKVLQTLMLCVIRALEPIDLDNPFDEHLEDDFGENELEPFTKGLQKQFLRIIEFTASFQPELPLTLLANEIGDFGNASTAKYNLILKACFSGLSGEEVFQSETAAQAATHILGHLLKFNPSCPRLQHYQAEAFHACILFIFSKPDVLPHIILKVSISPF